MRILFMGTPEISSICLEALLQTKHEVIGVVTQPDKPQGRGYTLTPPPTKVLAQEHGISVYQPEKIKTPEFETLLQDLNPDIIVVVAYGKILPSFVLHQPKYGCINVHVSLLPRFRGAAPMQRAIMAGDKKTGVTIMQMDEGLDTGDILLQESFPITEQDTFETIHDKSASVGAKLLPIVLEQFEKGLTHPQKQDETGACYAPKIEKSECEIDFNQTISTLHPIMQGLTPIPMPHTYLPNGKMLKVCQSHRSTKNGAPGIILSLSEKGQGEIVVGCREGSLVITQVRPEGKGTMSSSDFLRGAHLEVGMRLGK